MPERIRKFGPASNWVDLSKTLTQEHRLWAMSFDDVLIYYDGPLVSVGQFKNDPDKSLYLRIDAGISSSPDDQSYPRTMQRITHYLEFASRERIDATLHEETLPTLETYRQAASVLRELCSWTVTAPGKPDNCAVHIANVTLAEINNDELPYSHLQPGNVMTFAAPGFEELRDACAPHYLYPLPNDHLLVFHDVARCWIGKSQRLGRTSFHLNWMVDQRGEREINYRLSFDSEEALRATLYQGYVATRETYDQATQIIREELDVSDSLPGEWNLKIETLKRTDVPDDELPNPQLRPCSKPAGTDQSSFPREA